MSRAFLLGAIAVVLFLVGLIRLPAALASGDGAFTAGAVAGVLIWAVAAVLLFLRGVKVRRG